MAAGAWINDDYVSWLVSAVFGIMFLVVLTFEFLVRFQKKVLWYVVGAAIVVNSIKIALVFVYLQTGWIQGDWTTAGTIYKVYAVVQAFVYAISDYAMYQRKAGVCPSQNYADQIALGLCIVFGTSQCIPVLIGNVDGTFQPTSW